MEFERGGADVEWGLGLGKIRINSGAEMWRWVAEEAEGHSRKTNDIYKSLCEVRGSMAHIHKKGQDGQSLWWR